MERETHTIEMSGGHKATLNSYVTAREFRDIRNASLRGAKVSAEGDGTQHASFDPATAVEAGENASITAVVIELDGSRENILDRINALRVGDYQELWAAVEAVTKKK